MMGMNHVVYATSSSKCDIPIATLDMDADRVIIRMRKSLASGRIGCSCSYLGRILQAGRHFCHTR